MPAGADNVAAGNVPSASPKATAACQGPAARVRERRGLRLQTRCFSPNLESDAQPVKQGPGARGHLTQGGHIGFQEVGVIAPLPPTPVPGTETRVAQSRGAGEQGPEAAATPGTRKGRG